MRFFNRIEAGQMSSLLICINRNQWNDGKHLWMDLADAIGDFVLENGWIDLQSEGATECGEMSIKLWNHLQTWKQCVADTTTHSIRALFIQLIFVAWMISTEQHNPPNESEFEWKWNRKLNCWKVSRHEATVVATARLQLCMESSRLDFAIFFSVASAYQFQLKRAMCSSASGYARHN